MAYLFDSSMAAPPTLNRQLGMSMERSLPKYQFCVMFSVLTTKARLLGYTYDTQQLITYAKFKNTNYVERLKAGV